jgi:dihydroxyacetone kinase
MARPKKVLNDPTHSVDEFIAGLLLQCPNRLVKLQNHHVILTATPHSTTVQLLSGGGSGHEPSHAGWIGPGMLSGAICGGIFASPSIASILAAIRACAAVQQQQQQQEQQPPNPKTSGVLLIVKNYTGDRLNFGMATELANQEGIPCQMVVVADDTALERTKGITGARGVAGTVLVHKVAGAAATLGMSLDEIVSIIGQLTSRMGTLGIALDSVTVPGAETVNNRLDESTIEIGLGIHGEAGLKQSRLLSANEMAKEMIDTIRAYGRTVVHQPQEQEDDGTTSNIVPLFEEGDELCILVNNLGGTSNFEMSILANSCIKYLEGTTPGGDSSGLGCKVTRMFVGSYMTSFNMHGVSLTIVNLSGASEQLVSLLDAPCDAPAWSSCDIWKGSSDGLRPSATERPEVVVDKKTSEKQIQLPPLQFDNFSDVVRPMIVAAAKALASAEAMLTRYDTLVGDGDAGITMKRGATEVLDRINKGTIAMDHPVSVFADMADAVSDSMGGTSGVLLELMLRKMSSTLSRVGSSIGVLEMAQAFQAGVDVISLYGGATVGSRTMLDAMVPASRALIETKSLSEASRMARLGADGTAEMASASAGRSNYLSEDTLTGTPDPGAVAVAIVFEALTSSL